MRIAIIGDQRSGTFKLAHTISNAWGLQNLHEWIGNHQTTDQKQDQIILLDSKDNFVVTFTTATIANVGIQSINWSSFDIVCATFNNEDTDTRYSYRTSIFHIDGNFLNLFREWRKMDELTTSAVQQLIDGYPNIRIVKFKINEITNQRTSIAKLVTAGILRIPHLVSEVDYAASYFSWFKNHFTNHPHPVKIAVVGYARTGSTKIGQTLASMFNVQNVGEHLGLPVRTDGDRVIQFGKAAEINQRTNIVVKFLTFQFHNYPIPIPIPIDWQSFDLIVTTERMSKVDAAISSYVGGKRNLMIAKRREGPPPPIEQFIANVDDIIDLDDTPSFERLIKYIPTQTTVPLLRMHYEDIIDEEKLYEKLSIVSNSTAPANYYSIPLGINYREKCLNYDEIVAKFKELGRL